MQRNSSFTCWQTVGEAVLGEELGDSDGDALGGAIGEAVVAYKGAFVSQSRTTSFESLMGALSAHYEGWTDFGNINV